MPIPLPHREAIDLARPQQILGFFLRTVQTRAVGSTTYLRSTLTTNGEATRHWPAHAESLVPSARELRIPDRLGTSDAPDGHYYDWFSSILLLGRWLVLPVATGGREENRTGYYDLNTAGGDFEELLIYRAPSGLQSIKVYRIVGLDLTSGATDYTKDEEDSHNNTPEDTLRALQTFLPRTHAIIQRVKDVDGVIVEAYPPQPLPLIPNWKFCTYYGSHRSPWPTSCSAKPSGTPTILVQSKGVVSQCFRANGSALNTSPV
ncbi:hypothetical protein BV22DRAFT_1127278 [Leucogyrophana mollusca]|uniref:Uncharacterized protein n=1 Tax=Leucogyrophana mollusca TaxID=85980 RepID=A0ACB8BPM6_9AGAM|nr:hypothetical protein BV22DRAFT_1127278 [Leucogyrophana mollusca]